MVARGNAGHAQAALRIMAAYMPKVGTRGLDMMFRTAPFRPISTSSSEADMVEEVRVGLALQPLVTALFANSPFSRRQANGWLSQRSEIWRDTDPSARACCPSPSRTASASSAMSITRSTCRCISSSAATLSRCRGRELPRSAGRRLPQLPGERATISDWANHLSTIFPEVRLKTYLEMRGADGGPRDHHDRAAGALFRAFLRRGALDGASELIKGWSAAERENCARMCRARLKIDRRPPLREIAQEVSWRLRAAGLARRAFRDEKGRDETVFLEPLRGGRIRETPSSGHSDLFVQNASGAQASIRLLRYARFSGEALAIRFFCRIDALTARSDNIGIAHRRRCAARPEVVGARKRLALKLIVFHRRTELNADMAADNDAATVPSTRAGSPAH